MGFDESLSLLRTSAIGYPLGSRIPKNLLITDHISLRNALARSRPFSLVFLMQQVWHVSGCMERLGCLFDKASALCKRRLTFVSALLHIWALCGRPKHPSPPYTGWLPFWCCRRRAYPAGTAYRTALKGELSGPCDLLGLLIICILARVVGLFQIVHLDTASDPFIRSLHHRSRIWSAACTSQTTTLTPNPFLVSGFGVLGNSDVVLALVSAIFS